MFRANTMIKVAGEPSKGGAVDGFVMLDLPHSTSGSGDAHIVLEALQVVKHLMDGKPPPR